MHWRMMCAIWRMPKKGPSAIKHQTLISKPKKPLKSGFFVYNTECYEILLK